MLKRTSKPPQQVELAGSFKSVTERLASLISLEHQTTSGEKPSRAPHEGRNLFPGGKAWLWALLVVVLLGIHLFATDNGVRLLILRSIVLLAALGEALAFVSNALRPRLFSERCGRPYDPAYHGVMQDFGFYNLATALLLGLAVLDPTGNRIIVGVIVASYVVHATTHVLRYLGIYFGGGHPIPTRPQEFELRDGLQLILPAMGMLLFFP